jgi:acetyl esterase
MSATSSGQTYPRRTAAHLRRRGLRASLAAATCATLLAALALAPSALGEVIVRQSTYGTVYEHLLYGPKFRQNLNVFVSATPDSPIVVLIHGGGWRYYDALVHFEMESLALQQQGFTVFTINYDQDSETTPAFPGEPNDVELAIRWALSNAATYHGNPGKLVLLGGSAGGHLAAVAAEQINAAAPGTVKGVISLSGPTDFRTLVPLIEHNALPNEEFDHNVYQAVGREPNGTPYMYTNPAEEEAFEAKWSPALNAPTKGCPRWLLFHSEAELIPLTQAQQLNAKLHEAGCSSTLQVLPGSRHAFAYWKEVTPQIFSFINGI